jgi:hypothetical protein
MLAYACLNLVGYSPPLGQMIDSRQASSKMERLLIGCRDCHAESNVLGRCSHGRDRDQGLGQGPLGSRDDGRVQRLLVDIITSYKIVSFWLQAWDSGFIPRTSAIKMPWNLASSRSLASSTQCSVSLNFHDSSSGCLHSPGDWWPLPMIPNDRSASRQLCRAGEPTHHHKRIDNEVLLALRALILGRHSFCCRGNVELRLDCAQFMGVFLETLSNCRSFMISRSPTTRAPM